MHFEPALTRHELSPASGANHGTIAVDLLVRSSTPATIPPLLLDKHDSRGRVEPRAAPTDLDSPCDVHDRTNAQLASPMAVRDDLAIGSGTPVIVEGAGDAVGACRARGVTDTLEPARQPTCDRRAARRPPRSARARSGQGSEER